MLAVIVLCLTTCLTSFAQTSDEARRFDEFGNICCADLKARLDNFATHLLIDPMARGYIILGIIYFTNPSFHAIFVP